MEQSLRRETISFSKAGGEVDLLLVKNAFREVWLPVNLSTFSCQLHGISFTANSFNRTLLARRFR
ncbi:hypothetical protein NOR51B_1150 [Luminiphilus syltensis NOR5-1B]|uniref:Uncharacterized protein n=1 Tax=Luminiphilus syltensis NOR5-1B TaxID=565045 RepID=B8KV71_9GAMM|nr:hypothetical protein NOR51B_1150 [Luminiphilus syltensis NOR5-1B]